VAIQEFEHPDSNTWIDPDPLSVVLELANLVIHPGSLALLVAAVGSAAAVIQVRKISDSQRAKIRGKLYVIDRSLNDGFRALMTLASFLDEFQLLERPIRIGGAAIFGFSNAQRSRRAHEDCRAAVKEMRDAFIDLSCMLTAKLAERIDQMLRELNEVYARLVTPQVAYGVSLVAASHSLTVIDRFICDIGGEFDYHREPRSFTNELLSSLPFIRRFQ